MSKRFKTEPYIRYANCYEDAETLLKVVGSAQNILSIASGGDNTLALLTAPKIKHVTVFDKNPAQLALTKLKFAAFKYLDYAEVLTLLGVTSGNTRMLYNRIHPHLDTQTKNYFDANINLISKIKLVNSGKFEYYLNKIRTIAIGLSQTKKTLNQFFNLDIVRQKDFYLSKICNRRWNFITKRLFSQKVVSRLGRDRVAFNYANSNLYTSIIDRFLLCLDNVPNSKNIYLQYTVFGEFVELPFYLKKENFSTIKANVDKVSFVLGDINTVASQGTKFDFFNLSDIFEYMSEEQASENEFAIASIANHSAMVVFWNMIVDRQFTSDAFVASPDDAIKEIYINEKAYYYRALRIYKKVGDKA